MRIDCFYESETYTNELQNESCAATLHIQSMGRTLMGPIEASLFDPDRSAERTPITVLTGFLGSGKTTLLNRLLRAPELADTAVIINEFGEIGLDHLLVDSVDGEMIVLKSGCVCCTLRSDLESAIRALLAKRDKGEIPSFKRIVIETTGLADPAPIMQLPLANPLISHFCTFEGVATTVDALHAERQLAEHGEARNQVAHADRILITKSDLVPDAMAKLRETLDALNIDAPRYLIETDSLDVAAILPKRAPSAMDRARAWINLKAPVNGAPRPMHSQHGGGIEALCLESEKPVNWDVLQSWLAQMRAQFGAQLLRAKGIVAIEGADFPLVIHGVHHVFHPPVRLERWPSEWSGSKLVLIFRDGPIELIRQSWVEYLLGGDAHAANIAVDPALTIAPSSLTGRHLMQTVNVSLLDRAYPIHIGSGQIGASATYEKFIAGDTVAIVTNETIAPLYLARVKSAIAALGKRIVEIILPDGEAHKSAASLDVIYSALLAEKCDRKTTIVALGGGVIGDVAGYAAATYQRGIAFIQVPTTLLAQVDSSVGGKTAINHPLGKNMIGAFYQPVAVISDTETLKTLPPREYASGMAEIIKHALIFDFDHLAELERDAALLNARDDAVLARVSAHSCRIKADVVKRDERETLGVRALLNLGHTFGHAIETEMGYGKWLHGEAVAAGCVLAAQMSYELGQINAAEVNRVERIFAAFNLPTTPPKTGAQALMKHMQRDKKNEGGTITLVLLKHLGEAYLERAVSEAKLLAFLERHAAL
jgi:3-dehydroquinate synthase